MHADTRTGRKVHWLIKILSWIVTKFGSLSKDFCGRHTSSIGA